MKRTRSTVTLVLLLVSLFMPSITMAESSERPGEVVVTGEGESAASIIGAEGGNLESQGPEDFYGPSQTETVTPTSASLRVPYSTHIAGGDLVDQKYLWQPIEVWLTGGMLIFTLCVLGLLTHIVKLHSERWGPRDILRVFGLVLIVSSAIILVTAGFDSDHTGPAVGLLGVIAGYLLGTDGQEAKKT